MSDYRPKHRCRILEYLRPVSKWMPLSRATTEEGLNRAIKRMKERLAIVEPYRLEIEIDA